MDSEVRLPYNRYPRLDVVDMGVSTDQWQQVKDLFAAVLDQLCRIGSAYKQEPGVEL